MKLQIAGQQSAKSERIVNISLVRGSNSYIQVQIDGEPIFDFIETEEGKIIARRYNLTGPHEHIATDKEPKYGVPVIRVGF